MRFSQHKPAKFTLYSNEISDICQNDILILQLAFRKIRNLLEYLLCARSSVD